MFGFLKKKLTNAIDSLSEKFKKKEVITEKVEAAKEEIEKRIEEIQIEEKKPEEIIEEIKPIVEQEVPEAKEEIERTFEEMKPAIKEEVAEIRKEIEEEAEIETKKEAEEKIKEVIEERKPEIRKEMPREKKSLFRKLTEKIVKTVTEKRLTEEDFNPVLDELESGLIESDVAYEVAEKIKSDLKKSLVNKEIKRGKEREIVVGALKQSILEILSVPDIDLKGFSESKKPVVILLLGFNGSGKTTSLAKLAKWLIENGKSCVFAASDTFRAASLEQLEEHGKRIGVKVIKHEYNADPAAVAFDAIAHAKANGIDFVLIDTAGRAHTNRNLMDQMQKIIRVNKPDFKILVIDSLTGNDAVLQARVFNEVGIDGVIFTKIDVNEKGGAVLSVTYELKKPILFLSMGQEYSEFIRFNAKEFVDRLM